MNTSFASLTAESNLEEADRAFTLLEMLVVIALLSVFVGLLGVRFDMLGTDARRELKRFRTFLKSQHARVLRNGTNRTLRLNVTSDAVTVHSNGGSQLKEFQFRHWKFGHEDPLAITLTPVGVFGPETFEVTNGRTSEKFRVDRLVAANAVRDSSDD